MTDNPPPLTTVIGASGPCPEVRDARGKSWKVGHPTQRAKSCLEQLAVACAVAEVRAIKGTVPPDAYAETFRELTDAIAARHYRTWGAGWQRVVWGPQSAHLFLLSLLRENHPDASEDDARALAGDNPEGVAAALAQVIPSFVTLLLDDRPEITPGQREAVRRVILEATAKFRPPTPPAPTHPTPAESSPSGSKPSRKNRGASRPG